MDGEVILSGDPMRLGYDLPFAFQIISPQETSRIYQSPVVAGSYLALATVAESVSAQKLTELKAKLEATKGKLESQDQAQLAALTREDILGDMFYAGVLGYYAEYNALGYLAGLSQKSHMQLIPSAGTYGYAPEVKYLFGFPQAIIPGGIEMDLDRVGNATSADGKGHDAWKNFNVQVGAISSILESAIPEQMFVTPENPGEAVSAVKALQKAAAQGQRIYHITQANMATALPNIHHDQNTMDEIRNALAVGKEVITHSDAITVPGWKGAGYVIQDQDTGAAAWKIGGGLNGAMLIVAGMVLAALTIAIAEFLTAGAPLGALAGLGAAKVLALMAVASASFIAAGIALIRGDLAGCGNYLTAAWGSLTVLVASILPIIGTTTIAIGAGVYLNDLNQRICR